ncbi:uncharacterized protein FIBRA_00247 [Fibroporia radiculosa]|uniref:Succinate-semialdehyde dehydrogenase, mitochondrial n=1 Tax=Fibroporia radiculosa TaxID=599839 RepID=J7SCN0_9APHY|nr:uncharacterized protein FIBRA_00247 [Fibroporia radiculosa]CCL98253.1 predicted protein [Fibroporia radiculosa]
MTFTRVTFRLAASAGRIHVKRKFPPRQTFALFRMASTSTFGLKDVSLVHMQGLIGGNWVDAHDGGKITVINPATDEELGTIPEMGLVETKEAIDAAGRAFKSWSKTTAKHRHDILMKFYALMQENQDDLARLVTLENGKPIAEARGEHAYAASFIEWFEVIPSPFPHLRNVVVKQPIGVVSILTPWNFPLAMITRKLGAALAAGCTVVVKPPPETPFSALALAELASRAGVPPGVFNVVTTQANISEVAREMCENDTVRKVTFTGSTPVAKLLYGYASKGMKKVSIEAGGNAAFIVFDDADVEAAVEGAILSKFRSSGQTCVCANRIYVQSSVYAEFASRLAEKIATFQVGNGLDSDTTHGPLIHDKAIKKVQRHVDDALARGAQLVMGGTRLAGKGSFFQPTVLSEVPPDALVNQEETFGPLAALTRFETEEQVLAWANSTPFGLASYCYTQNIGRAWRVAEALETGMVGTNTGMISQAVIPFGGVKESGLGFYRSVDDIAEEIRFCPEEVIYPTSVPTAQILTYKSIPASCEMNPQYYFPQYHYATPYLHPYYQQPHVSPFIPAMSLPPSPDPPRRRVHFDDEDPVIPHRNRRPSWHGDMASIPNPAPFPSPPMMYSPLPAMVPVGAPPHFTHHRRRSDSNLPQPAWYAVPAYPPFISPYAYQQPLPSNQLHPLLDGESRDGPMLVFDLSLNQFNAMHITERGRTSGKQLSRDELEQQATYPAIRKMRITCDLIPQWPIVLEPGKAKSNFLLVPSSSRDVPITVGDVLIAIHKSLQQQITHVDWVRLSQSEETAVARAYTRRCKTFPSVEAFEKSQGVRRVDFLLERFMFRGLKRSKADQDGFENVRLIVEARK